MPDVKRNNLSVRGIPKNTKISSMDCVTSIHIVLMRTITRELHLNTSCEHIEGN